MIKNKQKVVALIKLIEKYSGKKVVIENKTTKNEAKIKQLVKMLESCSGQKVELQEWGASEAEDYEYATGGPEPKKGLEETEELNEWGASEAADYEYEFKTDKDVETEATKKKEDEAKKTAVKEAAKKVPAKKVAPKKSK